MTSPLPPTQPTLRLVRPEEELLTLCERTSRIDPWLTLNLSPEWLMKNLVDDPPLEIHVAELTTPVTEGPSGLAGWISHVPTGAAEDFQYWGIEAAVRTAAGPEEGGYIRDLAVFPGYQGQGIGRLLLDTAARRTRECGLRRLFLSVSSFNHGAIRFYLRNGFRQVAEFPAMIHPDYSELTFLKDFPD